MQMQSTLLESRPVGRFGPTRAYAFFACAAAALLAAQVMRSSLALQPTPSPAQGNVQGSGVPSFVEAVRSLCDRRHAEAYGRFVALANDGDVRAGRIALVLHRLGPALFGSEWDASTEQLDTWARWSHVEGAGPVEPSTASSTRVLSGLCGSAAAAASVPDPYTDSSRRSKRRVPGRHGVPR